MGDSTDMELDAHKAVAAVDDAQKAHLKQSTLVPENGIQSLGNSSDLGEKCS